MEQTGRLTTEEEEEEIMKQRQDQHRRLKPPPPENQSHPHHQQPQKCPRCDSLNTKFCYYNNYSLTQPRYFCKACRRYWTQGGTLRNVPVGGGCRKGKRSKASSSGGENSRSHSSQPPLPPPPPPQHELQVPQNLATKELGMNLGIPPMSPYYSGGGGFFSSLAAMQSLSQPQAPFNQPLNIGGQFGSPSNLALLQGLNMQSFSSQQAQNHQIQHQNEFFQMGYQSLVQPTRPLGSWNQNLINNSSINPSGSNPSGNSLNPNQWPDQLP